MLFMRIMKHKHQTPSYLKDSGIWIWDFQLQQPLITIILPTMMLGINSFAFTFINTSDDATGSSFDTRSTSCVASPFLILVRSKLNKLMILFGARCWGADWDGGGGGDHRLGSTKTMAIDKNCSFVLRTWLIGSSCLSFVSLSFLTAFSDFLMSVWWCWLWLIETESFWLRSPQRHKLLLSRLDRARIPAHSIPVVFQYGVSRSLARSRNVCNDWIWLVVHISLYTLTLLTGESPVRNQLFIQFILGKRWEERTSES